MGTKAVNSIKNTVVILSRMALESPTAFTAGFAAGAVCFRYAKQKTVTINGKLAILTQ